LPSFFTAPFTFTRLGSVLVGTFGPGPAVIAWPGAPPAPGDFAHSYLPGPFFGVVAAVPGAGNVCFGPGPPLPITLVADAVIPA
jgi:hypothetical protein